jgi:hypothetical protein
MFTFGLRIKPVKVAPVTAADAQSGLVRGLSFDENGFSDNGGAHGINGPAPASRRRVWLGLLTKPLELRFKPRKRPTDLHGIVGICLWDRARPGLPNKGAACSTPITAD